MGILAAQPGIDIIEGPKFSVAQSTGRSFRARATLASGTLIQQAHFGTIVISVRDKDGTQTYTASLTIASVVFDALQTDSAWTEDSTGYNFDHEVPASAFATLGYRLVSYTFTPLVANGPAFGLTFEGTVTSLKGAA